MTDKLREAAQQALEAMEQAHDESLDENHFECRQVLMGQITALRTALAEQPAEQEPVAWMWKDGTLTSDPDRADGTWTPLYTAPQPAKQPLTDEEIDALELPPSGTATVRDLVRLIERAHGIGEQE